MRILEEEEGEEERIERAQAQKGKELKGGVVPVPPLQLIEEE